MKKIQKVLLHWPSPFAFYPPSLFPYGQRTWENFSRMEKTSDIILFLVTFSQDWKRNINQEVLKKFTYKKANLYVFSIFKWWPLYSKHLKETDVTTVIKNLILITFYKDELHELHVRQFHLQAFLLCLDICLFNFIFLLLWGVTRSNFRVGVVFTVPLVRKFIKVCAMRQLAPFQAVITLNPALVRELSEKQKEHFEKNLFFPYFLCSYKIWWLILTTSNHHDSLCWLIVGIWCTNQTPSANCLADSCHISSWQCIKIDRRISSLITSWNQFLKNIHIQWELSNKVQDTETYKHPGEIQVHGERITSSTFFR